jgi:hypothetical protein
MILQKIVGSVRSVESRNGNRHSFQAKSMPSWTTSSVKTKSFSNRDSSSDEDLIVIAKRLEMKKKKCKRYKRGRWKLEAALVRPTLGSTRQMRGRGLIII